MMTMLTTLPLDSFVVSAFAELLEDVSSLLTAAEQSKPLDRDEIAFWTRQLNALNKAEYNWTQGVRIVLADGAYLLPSASRPGALVHRLTRQGGILICSCEAGQKQTLCWHHMLVNIVERAAEMESEAQKDAAISGSGPESAPQAAAPSWQIGAYIGQQLLQSRLAATDAYLATLRAVQGRTAERAPRRLGVRLVTTRRKSASFASAFYLEAA